MPGRPRSSRCGRTSSWAVGACCMAVCSLGGREWCPATIRERGFHAVALSFHVQPFDHLVEDPRRVLAHPDVEVTEPVERLELVLPRLEAREPLARPLLAAWGEAAVLGARDERDPRVRRGPGLEQIAAQEL